jgi:two-component sensor histidine kinase
LKAYSVPALIIATICLTIALSDSLAWVKRNRRNGDIAFILVCLGGAAFCLCCAGEYSVDFPAQSIFWLKGEVIASCVAGFALLWYVSEVTRLVDRRVLAIGLAWMALSILSQFLDLGELTWVASRPLVLRVPLPFGLDFVYQEVARGIVLVIITSGGFAFHLYLLWVVFRFWRSGNRKESLILLSALGFIVVAQIIDVAIGVGLFSFVFLLEYAFLGTILVVGLNRSNDFIEAAVTRKALKRTNQALKTSQATLSTIIDSTADLIWSVDAEECRLLTFNRPFRDYFLGRNGQTVAAGMRFAELLDSEDEELRWNGIYRRCFVEGAISLEYSPPGLGRTYQLGIHPLLRDSQVFGLSVFAQDVTERKAAEEQIRRALVEKEVLLQEVYHRTKNNMNVIISILKLQSNQMDDQRLKASFAVAIDRIITMSLVHSRLYLSGDLSRIDLKDYLVELADRLLACHSLPGHRPSLRFELESIHVMIDVAINCGMIVNELVTNALKYAFPPGISGNAGSPGPGSPPEILIRLRRDQAAGIELHVADNGTGLPEGFDPKRNGRLGLRLIHTMAQDSLRGQMEFLTGPGLACTISFRLPEMARVPDGAAIP